MNKEVKFAILAALKVTPYDVKAYIEQAEGKKPKILLDPPEDKVVQSLDLTIAELTEYLEKLCSQTPLPLLCKTLNGVYVATNTISTGLDVTGIILKDRVLYLKALTYDEGCRLASINDLDGWVRKNFPEVPGAHLTSPDDIKSVMDTPLFQLTLEILEYNKHDIPWTNKLGCLKRETAQVWVGADPYPVHMYLKYCGDLLVFGNVPKNSIGVTKLK